MVIAVITPVADPIKLYFFPDEEFLCFTLAATLGHFNISYFFLHVTKHSNYTAKIGKWRKKSYIGWATGKNK